MITALAASSGYTGASWGFGFPLLALCQGALIEVDESPWNDGDLFQHCLGVGQGIFLSYYHLEICCILEETNLTRKLNVHGPEINRSRKAVQGPPGELGTDIGS